MPNKTKIKGADYTSNLIVLERDLLATVIEFAQAHGWKTAHFRPGMTNRTDKHGNPVWITAVQGDGGGFPDLVLLRNKSIIFVEVKAERGRLSMAQNAWIAALKQCAEPACPAREYTRMEVYVWRPSDWPEIVEVLG